MFRAFSILALYLCNLHIMFASEWTRIELTRDFYSEGGDCGDINQDGHIDLIAGPYIYYGPDFQAKSELYPASKFSIDGYSDNFLSYVYDINQDSWPDVIVFGFPGKETWYFENPGSSEESQKQWTRFAVFQQTDNESPTLKDVTGDDVPEIVCCHGEQFGYAEIPADPTKEWKFVAVSERGDYQRFTHGIGVGDVNDDGRQDMLAAHGWWANPGNLNAKSLEDSLWEFHAFPFAQTSAQMYAVDLDGDGETEIVTSLQAHGRGLVIYDKVHKLDSAEWTWRQQAIMTNDAATSPTGLAISQLHAVNIADFNADGVPDILTGKRYWAHQGKDEGAFETPYLVWFETVRTESGSMRFVPHIIDDDSGVGTQITAADLNADGKIDVFSASKRGVHVLLQN